MKGAQNGEYKMLRLLLALFLVIGSTQFAQAQPVPTTGEAAASLTPEQCRAIVDAARLAAGTRTEGSGSGAAASDE